MINRGLALIGITLLSAQVAAQDTVLYNNPYDPAGLGDCSFSGACSFPGTVQDAQSFVLVSASLLQSVSFTVSDYGPIPNQTHYDWGIYTSANGLPTGSPGPLLGGNVTVTPMASGEVWNPLDGMLNSYSAVNIAAPASPAPLSLWTNVVTFNTGPVNLGPGTYFLALNGFGPSVEPEQWDQGLNNSGAATSNYGIWSPGAGGGVGGLAITIKGVSAPEIDPSSAIGGLTLLFGGLTILRARRPTKTQA